MLTQENRNTFRLALASACCYSVKNVADLDISEIIEDEGVVETAEAVSDFINRSHYKSHNLTNTLVGELHEFTEIQRHKGARRGTLYVMDFGHARACYFDGE